MAINICAKCETQIGGEFEMNVDLEPVHKGKCPTTPAIGSAQIAPQGFKLPNALKRHEVNLADKQMNCIHLASLALYMGNNAINADSVYQMWPTDGASKLVHGERPQREDIAVYMGSIVYHENMKLQGVELNLETLHISGQQMAVLEMMRNPEGRTRAQILKKLGIKVVVFNAWMRQPVFNKYLKSVVGNATEDALLLSEMSLADKAADGDLNATKFLWEFTGKHNPQREANVDYQKLLEIILDVVQTNVHDPEVLSKIKQQISFRSQAVKGAF